VPFELGYPNLNLSVSVAKRTGNQQSKHWQVFTVGPERNSANIMEPFATLKEASAHFMKLFKKVNDEA
jgi:hypothetical protein